MSRQTEYKEEIAFLICERLADGESLRSICGDENMPARSTVFKWLAEQHTFSDQYARAREEQAHVIFDEILDIADDGSNDWMERKFGEDTRWVENGETLRRSQLRIDARKWMAGKLQPKKYGDKIHQELTGKDGGAIEVADMTDIERARRVAFALVKASNAQDA